MRLDVRLLLLLLDHMLMLSLLGGCRGLQVLLMLREVRLADLLLIMI